MSLDNQIIQIAEAIVNKNDDNNRWGFDKLDKDSMWDYLVEFGGFSHQYFSKNNRFDQAWELAY